MATMAATDKLKIGSGLKNIGNSCFFNATIQALFHTSCLTSCFRVLNTTECKCIICAVRKLFEKTKCSALPSDPSTLYEQLKKINIRFCKLLNRKKQDAHEFHKLLIEVMKNENHPNYPLENKFIALTNTEIECLLCKAVFVRDKKYPIQEFIVNIREQHSVKLALQSYFEGDIIDEYACVSCMKNVMAKRKITLRSSPECLCIILNRFENRYAKITSHIEIDQQLNLKCFADKKVHEFKYRLASVISHIGTNLRTGHYIAFVNSENTLYKFDDTYVSECEKTEIAGRDAYILFYERIEESDNPDSEEAISIDGDDIHDSEETISVDEDECVENSNEWTMYDIMNKCGVNIENEVISTGKTSVQRENEKPYIDDSEHLTPIEIIDEDECMENANECMINDIIEVIINGDSLQDMNEDSEDWIPIDIIDDEINSSETHNLPEGNDIVFMENEVIKNEIDDRGSSIIQNEDELSSRRIVDVEHIFRQMEKSFRITCKLCGGEITYTNEMRRGLISNFRFACKSCNRKKKVDSCPKNKNQANNNEAAVLGMISVGLGFYHLEELFAHFNIPCMTYQTFYNVEQKLQADWCILAKKLEAEALTEEIRLAKENNEVDSAGNALIGGKGDGSYPKRAYGGRFSSLAGCASIFGLRTNKIIYCGVKSKYCHICKIAESRNSPPNKHECHINYTGPTSGMESAIIVDGFKHCAEQGARFDKFVGDGDSSTYKTIRDLRLYKNPHIFTMKFGCVNHLHKNFLKKFYTLVAKPKFKASRSGGIISRRIGEDISKGIRMAAKHWNDLVIPLGEKCRGLARDCMSAPLHYLGIHDNCSEYFCTKITSPSAQRHVALLKNNGFYYDLLRSCQHYFANNALSLLAGYDTNIVEGFNSLIAKLIGAKRVCNNLAGSYKLRTEIAEVHLNSDYHGGSTFQQFRYGKVVPAMLKMENKRKRKVENNTIQQERKPKKRKADDNEGGRKKKKHYGEGREDMDMEPEEFEVAKNILLEQLNDDRKNRHSIQIETREQSCSWKYHQVKQNLLTSSYFGRILHVRSRTSYKKIVEDILYHNIQHSNAAELTHQRLYELEALEIFRNIYKNELIDICGIFIDEKYSFLGASPFRLFGQDGIVVIKCPIKAYKKKVNDAIEEKLIPFWKKSKGSEDLTVDCNSHLHYEIQGQLHISGKKFAILMVYLGQTEYKIVKVERNDQFWNEKMESELVYFFNEAMLKELVDSRDGRSMELREYHEKSNTFI